MRNRTFIYAAVAAALLASCGKDEALREDISFAPVASKATKAIIEGTTYPVDESFVVSAFYGGSEPYFENSVASYTSTNSLWETSTSEYWPLSGSLTFHAYSPAGVNGVSISSAGVTATNYIIQSEAQMETDLCFASATVADCDNHPASVPLDFNHALSQVVFRVKAADYYSTATNTVTLELNSLALNGIYSRGYYSEGAWSCDTEHTYSLSATPTVLTYDANNDSETIVLCSYLFIPQTLGADAAISVGYSVTQSTLGTLSNSPVSIALGGTVNQWEPGKKYIYTLIIGMNNLITFTASSVGWSDDSSNIIVEE